jgi:outer membrane receptor protein involved in Fe transport
MRILLILFLAITSIYNSNAQNAKIFGKVKETKTGEEVIGGALEIIGTTIGSITDFDGNFEIENLKPGQYQLLCSYIGFKKDTVDITLVANQQLEVNFSLKDDSELLETVVITAVRKVASEVAVLNTMKESRQIVSGLSAEYIKKTQDSDASQVVKRIPGVTVIGDRFVVIRGLNERYNTTLLHNINTPSMEPDVRSFSLDVLPGSIIDQVLIYKSPAPELPGDFSGGAIKIFTKSIPDENSLIFDVSTGFRNGTSMRTFLAEERRSGHFTGFNDGKNDLPSDFPERLSGLPNDQIDQWGKSLPNNWSPSEYNSGLDFKVSLTHNYAKNFSGQKQLGIVTGFMYSNTKTIFNTLNQAFEAYDFVNEESKLRYSFEDREYGQEIMGGVVSNWAFRFNNNHIIEWKNLYNQLTSRDYVDRMGEQIAQGFNQNNHAFLNEYRGLYSGQLVGNHRFANDKMKIEWIGGYGYSFNDLPDYRRYRINIAGVDDETQPVLFVPRGQTPDFLGRFYSTMSENIYSAALNYSFQINKNRVTNFKPMIKAGTYYEVRDRMFEARNLGFNRGFNFDEDLTLLSVQELFNPENVNSNTGVRLGENFSTSNFFNAGNDLLAYYLSLDIPVTEKLTLFGGLRVEDNFQFLRSPDRFEEGTSTPPFEPVEIKQTIALPSVTLAYDLGKSMFLKAVYGKTINRPEFREIAPFGFYDFVFDATVTGYSFLRNATVDNFDLRWEMYPSTTETISFALFYKRFTDPIESVYGNFGSEQSTFFFRNTESAIARGIEIDLRKSLYGMTSSNLLNKVSVMANVSLIDSEVTLGAELEELLRASDRPLQGQSGFIVNSGIFYDDKANNFQFNIAYNVIGKRILLVGAGAIPDTYEMPRNVIDMNVSKGLTDKLLVRFGVKDLLNQEFLLLQDGREDGNFDRVNDQIFRRFKPGSVFTLGLSYRIL